MERLPTVDDLHYLEHMLEDHISAIELLQYEDEDAEKNAEEVESCKRLLGMVRNELRKREA